MTLPTIETPSIKYVKKASQWVKTYFTIDPNTHKPKQVQEWSAEEPEVTNEQ